MRVVLGVSGGIAAYKSCALLRRLVTAGHDVTVVPTQAALRFVGEPTWAALSGNPVSAEPWDDVHRVPHVRIGQRADLVVVAPATADVVAKAAHGLADDLLSNVLLTARCPVLMAPAMHTEMWQHPATVDNVRTLRRRGISVLDPASGRLTGPDSGPGRLPEPEEIFQTAMGLLDGASSMQASEHPRAEQDMSGLSVVITAGGTREPIDPVRFVGNRSSGKQGYALAAVAAERGAEVLLISANSSLADPAGVRVQRVETAAELQKAVASAASQTGCDAVVMAAAVADYRPAQVAESKMKKDSSTEDGLTLEMVRNPDVLASLVRDRQGAGRPFLVGFAAETGDADGDVLAHARRKLERKGCDLLVANDVSSGGTFGADRSTIHLLTPDQKVVETVGPVSKTETAAAVWDAVLRGRADR
ncbi:MAG: bifunctional phosphopantothenoylcysteine decarboxylase/phosphopantothenate--cysteine ligase CoaBC [Ornithinimicrobium sp.]